MLWRCSSMEEIARTTQMPEANFARDFPWFTYLEYYTVWNVVQMLRNFFSGECKRCSQSISQNHQQIRKCAFYANSCGILTNLLIFICGQETFFCVLNSAGQNIPSMLVPPRQARPPLLPCLSNLSFLLIGLTTFLVMLSTFFFWFHLKPQPLQ